MNSPPKLRNRILPKLFKYFTYSLFYPQLRGGNHYLKIFIFFYLLYFFKLDLKKILTRLIIPIYIDLPEIFVPLNSMFYILLVFHLWKIYHQTICSLLWLPFFTCVFLCHIHGHVYSSHSLYFQCCLLAFHCMNVSERIYYSFEDGHEMCLLIFCCYEVCCSEYSKSLFGTHVQ